MVPVLGPFFPFGQILKSMQLLSFSLHIYRTFAHH